MLPPFMEERRKKERNMHEPAEDDNGLAHGVHQLGDEALTTFNNNKNKEHQFTNTLPSVSIQLCRMSQWSVTSVWE